MNWANVLDFVEGSRGAVIVPLHRALEIPPTITQYPTRVHAALDRLCVGLGIGPLLCPRCTTGVLCDLHR